MSCKLHILLDLCIVQKSCFLVGGYNKNAENHPKGSEFPQGLGLENCFHGTPKYHIRLNIKSFLVRKLRNM